MQFLFGFAKGYQAVLEWIPTQQDKIRLSPIQIEQLIWPSKLLNYADRITFGQLKVNSTCSFPAVV